MNVSTSGTIIATTFSFKNSHLKKKKKSSKETRNLSGIFSQKMYCLYRWQNVITCYCVIVWRVSQMCLRHTIQAEAFGLAIGCIEF